VEEGFAMKKTQKEIGVCIFDLGLALARSTGNKGLHGEQCLDFETGLIVDKEDCPEDLVGEGRPGLHAGKRYIRIPVWDELWQQVKSGLDRAQRKADRKEVKYMTPKQRRDLLGTFDYDRQYCAWIEVALRWLASLEPPFCIRWLEEDGEDVGSGYYDPDSRSWILDF
jgi:hypothetical protein